MMVAPGRAARRIAAALALVLALLLNPAVATTGTPEVVHFDSFETDADFGFGNFRTVTVGIDDLPELADLDLEAEQVFLKIYHEPMSEDGDEAVLFLGRVTSARALALRFSVPLAVLALRYDIYGTAGAASGIVSMAGRG